MLSRALNAGFLVFLPFLIQLSVVQAASNLTITDILNLIPPCSIPCVIEGTSQNPAIITHPESTCSNVTIQASLSKCIQLSCNYTEQARLAMVNMNLCEGIPVDESRQMLLFIVTVVFGPLSLIAIVLRTYSRYAITKRMGGDDWTMLAAGAILIGVMATSFRNNSHNGLGRHFWNIDPLKVTELLKIFYAAEILYLLEITLVKISILLFYLRVFPAKHFRLSVKITLAIVIASFIGILIPFIFNCMPINAAWDPSIPNAKCISVSLLAYALGGMGVGLDLIILVLPIPELLKLKMSRKKRRNVFYMFSLGSIACITSIIRLKYLADFKKSTDQTWDNIIPVIWSLIEICTAIICACLPALRALFAYHFPHIFGNESTVAGTSSGRLTPSLGTDRVVVSKFNIKGGSQTIITAGPANEKEKPIPLEAFVPLSPLPRPERSSWFVRSSFMTHNRKLERDIERNSQFGRLDSVGGNGSALDTEIWVGNTNSVKNGIESLHPLRANISLDFELPKTRTGMSYLDSKTSSGDYARRQSEIDETTSMSIKTDMSEVPFSRTGSEDSIFVLEGPRESDEVKGSNFAGNNRTVLPSSDLGMSASQTESYGYGNGLFSPDSKSNIGVALVLVEREREVAPAVGMGNGTGSRPGTANSGVLSRSSTSNSAGSGTQGQRHRPPPLELSGSRPTTAGSNVKGISAYRPPPVPVDGNGRGNANESVRRPNTSGAGAAASRPTTSGMGSGLRRSESRGNRYDEKGQLRRNASLDLRGGEVRIPMSAFNTYTKRER